MRLLLCFTLTLLGWLQPVMADETDVLRRVTDGFIIPHYAALETATGAQHAAWQNFCSAPSEADLSSLEAAFRSAADAWSSVEFIRFGPISRDNRHDRMAHWPERKNAVGKALANLLTRDDVAVFEPSRFAQTSVAGQGLSALERLIFEEDAGKSLVAGDEAKRRCAIGLAITRSLAAIAARTAGEWHAAPDLGDPRTAITRFATDLLTVYQMVGDLKLEAVMGDRPERSRAALAEGRRAGRSTRAVILNLKGAEALTRLVVNPDQGSGAEVTIALQTAIRIAENLPDNFSPLAEDPKGRLRLVLLVDAVRAARDLSNTVVPAALGITLGFNSLDGD